MIDLIGDLLELIADFPKLLASKWFWIILVIVIYIVVYFW